MLLLVASALHAQTPQLHFEHITLAGGLTDYRAFDIAQDSIGFLWFATNEGLYRYDGLTSTAFKPRLADSNGIASITNWCLVTDRNGRLWIGTFDAGLDCYDPAAGRVRHYRHDPSDSTSMSWGPVSALAEDRTGALWVGTEKDGVARLDPSRQRFRRFRHDPRDPTSLSNNSINAIVEDARGTVWIATDDGLNALRNDQRGFDVYRHHPGQRAGLSESNITSLLCDRDGSLWAGTDSSGLNRLEGQPIRITRFSRRTMPAGTLFCDSITVLHQNNRNYLWVGTLRGLYRFEPASGRSQQFTHNPLDGTSLGSDYIRAIRGDRTGVLWIASWEAGTEPQRPCISKLVQKSEQFGYWRIERSGDGALPALGLWHDPVRDIVWIATEGLRAFHRKSGRIVEYLNRPGDPGSLSNNMTRPLLMDRAGNLWVGTWGGGLNRFLPATLSFARHQWRTAEGKIGGAAVSLCEDILPPVSGRTKASTFWIGTFGEGVLHFSPTGGVLERYSHVSGDNTSLGNDRALAVLVDRMGTLWVGTDGGGLNKFDRNTGRFTVFTHNPGDPSTLRSPRITTILEDTTLGAPGGTALWVGTATGLDRFDVARARATHIMLRDSAEAMGIAALTYQGEDLWIGTVEDGLFKRSLRTGVTREYREENGLPSNEFSGAAFTTQDGELLLGQYEGFLAFHPETLCDNPIPPPLVLTALSVFDTLYHTPAPLWSVPLIDLDYDQDFFSFRFAALDYADPERNMFAYKLEGFDEEWRRPGTRNFAGYTKVDPGEYTFRVKGANSDGVWNESGVAIGLRIAPPYWRTWWFRVLIALTLLALLTGAYRYRVAKLLEMERMRVRIASDLHDDIGSSLSGIALLTDSLKSRRELEEKDRQHLADVTRTARHTADALRDIVWLVNPEHDTVDDLFLRMKDAAAIILSGIEYTITTSGQSVGHVMPLEFRHNLILIYKELLNNIARHAHARHATIAIHREQDQFSLSIVDDGIGFDIAAVKRGNGLGSLQHRAELIGGRLSLDSTPGKGTTAKLSVRIQ